MRRADIEVPNRSVDMDSWDRSACYPRGTFYPLSDGPSTWDRRITRPCFRTCSTCRSRSQAPLCPCTRQLIADQLEGTFGRLRYSLGGDRPSQTTHLALSPHPDHGRGLGTQHMQSGISRLAPPEPESELHSLPPILRNTCQVPIPRCSKGPRGLSVLPRVTSIFTRSAISPSPQLRQCPSRYAIRAGRNFVSLPCFQGDRTMPSSRQWPGEWFATGYPRRPLGFMPVISRTTSRKPPIIRWSPRAISSHTAANDSKSLCLEETIGYLRKWGIIRSMR